MTVEIARDFDLGLHPIEFCWVANNWQNSIMTPVQFPRFSSRDTRTIPLRIFAAFERLHGVEEFAGSGIAVVKRGIERMEGAVGVESQLG